MVIELNYCLQTLIVEYIKLKQKIRIKMNIKIIRDFIVWKNRKVNGKMKMKPFDDPIVEFAGLKSMYSYIRKRQRQKGKRN